MVKYTLGALAAFAIIIVTAFVVIAQVTDGDAVGGPAPIISFVVYDDHVSPERIEVQRGRILDFRLDNQSIKIQTIIVGGEGVEVLPQLSTSHDEPSVTEIRSSIAVDVAPGRSRDILVRFTRAGEYDLGVYRRGTFQREFGSSIAVK